MYKVFVVFLFFVIIAGCGQKEIEKSQSDEIQTSESKTKTKAVDTENFTIKFSEDLQEKFRHNKSILNKKHTLNIISTLDEITPITKKMIHASDNELNSLLKQANQTVQRYGFDDLDDYGKELFTITWAAGTFLKLQEIEKIREANPDAKSVKFLTDNLVRRLDKQPISLNDIKLIRNNWNRINSALDKMSDLVEERINSS